MDKMAIVFLYGQNTERIGCTELLQDAFQHSILQEDHFTIIKNNCIIQKIINLKKTL